MDMRFYLMIHTSSMLHYPLSAVRKLKRLQDGI